MGLLVASKLRPFLECNIVTFEYNQKVPLEVFVAHYCPFRDTYALYIVPRVRIPPLPPFSPKKGL